MDSKLTVSIEKIKSKKIYAVCGIGNPNRFFTTLRTMGIEFIEKPFPDHHAFSKVEY